MAGARFQVCNTETPSLESKSLNSCAASGALAARGPGAKSLKAGLQNAPSLLASLTNLRASHSGSSLSQGSITWGGRGGRQLLSALAEGAVPLEGQLLCLFPESRPPPCKHCWDACFTDWSPEPELPAASVCHGVGCRCVCVCVPECFRVFACETGVRYGFAQFRAVAGTCFRVHLRL